MGQSRGRKQPRAEFFGALLALYSSGPGWNQRVSPVLTAGRRHAAPLAKETCVRLCAVRDPIGYILERLETEESTMKPMRVFALVATLVILTMPAFASRAHKNLRAHYHGAHHNYHGHHVRRGNSQHRLS